MSEQDKQQLGDGSINYADAAQKTAKAIKEAGKAAAEKTAAAAGEATANTTAAVAQAGVEGGKAVAEVATGTAAGGPWGAIIAAAWALRKPIFKVLICLGLVILFFIMAVVTLPSIISNNLFHTDPSTVDPNGAVDLIERTDDMSDVVAACIQNGYDAALARVEQIIEENGYDYETSMDALVNYGSLNPDYEVCYVFAAYSASMGQVGTSEADMRRKLDAVAEQMFKITYEEKEFERVIPLTYSTYTPVTLTVVTGRTKIGEVNGVPNGHANLLRPLWRGDNGNGDTAHGLFACQRGYPRILPWYHRGRQLRNVLCGGRRGDAYAGYRDSEIRRMHDSSLQ